MPTRSIILLIMGITIAIGAAWSIKNRMSKSQAAAGTRVLVAVSDIPAGSFVRNGSHIAMVDWPESAVTDSMFREAATNISEFEGAVARRAIAKGEPILKNMLVKSNEGGFMSAVLEPGKRAVSIAVDETTGNAGFIFPGDHVDLILTHAVNIGGDKERASETFVEDVRVLAVDQRLENPENKAILAKTVTLEVTPKQAEAINVAKDLGKINLSLRSLASAPPEAEPDKATAVETPETPASLDDMLHQAVPGEEAPEDTPVVVTHPSNLTRDTDVSKVISPRGGEGSRVRVLRGGQEPQDIEFNRDGGPRVQ